MVRLPNKISKPHTIMKTTIPGVRLPIIASLIEAMMIETIEQNFKKLSIELIFKLYYLFCESFLVTDEGSPSEASFG